MIDRFSPCINTWTSFLYLNVQSKWSGILHHVVNNHEWISGSGIGAASCDHGPLLEEDRTKEWLEPGGAAHVQLRKLVLDANFCKNLSYYITFR